MVWILTKLQTWVAVLKRSETIHHSSNFGWGVGNAIHFLWSGKRMGIALLFPQNHPLLHYQQFLPVSDIWLLLFNLLLTMYWLWRALISISNGISRFSGLFLFQLPGMFGRFVIWEGWECWSGGMAHPLIGMEWLMGAEDIFGQDGRNGWHSILNGWYPSLRTIHIWRPQNYRDLVFLHPLVPYPSWC